MFTITQESVLAKLPIAELRASLRTFLAPVTERLPDARLPAVAELMVHGIIASQSPLITQIARGAGHDDASIWPTSKRAYRFLENERFNHRLLLKGLYGWPKRRWLRNSQPTWWLRWTQSTSRNPTPSTWKG